MYHIISPGAEEKPESIFRDADVNWWLSRDIEKHHFGAEIYRMLRKREQEFLNGIFMLEVTKRCVRKKMFESACKHTARHTSANATD